MSFEFIKTIQIKPALFIYLQYFKSLNHTFKITKFNLNANVF